MDLAFRVAPTFTVGGLNCGEDDRDAGIAGDADSVPHTVLMLDGVTFGPIR